MMSYPLTQQDKSSINKLIYTNFSSFVKVVLVMIHDFIEICFAIQMFQIK